MGSTFTFTSLKDIVQENLTQEKDEVKTPNIISGRAYTAKAGSGRGKASKILGYLRQRTAAGQKCIVIESFPSAKTQPHIAM